MMDHSPTQLIAQAILLHLEQCPASADTVEGIQAWWIDACALGASLAGTLTALEQLERDRKVERLVLGGRQLWRKARPAFCRVRH